MGVLVVEELLVPPRVVTEQEEDEGECFCELLQLCGGCEYNIACLCRVVVVVVVGVCVEGDEEVRGCCCRANSFQHTRVLIHKL